MHGLVVAAGHRINLRLESGSLVFGIVEFGETVREFLAADEEFEAVGDALLRVRLARQRRDFHRIMGDEGRLREFAFDGFLENFQEQLAPAVTRFDLHFEPHAMRSERIAITAIGNTDFRIHLANGFFELPAPERRCEIDIGAVPMHLRGADRFDRNIADQCLRQIHHFAVSDVGLVQLQHRELGIVPCGYAFVAEITVDFVYAFKATDNESLEIQLRCNPQVQIKIECVVVGCKRLRSRAAGDVMHHRRFDFEKASRIQPAANCANDARTLHKHIARFRCHDQIDVTLAITLLDIGQPMPLVRQWPQRLREQTQLVAANRQLAGFGAHQHAFDRDDVADIPTLERVVAFTQR